MEQLRGQMDKSVFSYKPNEKGEPDFTQRNMVGMEIIKIRQIILSTPPIPISSPPPTEYCNQTKI